MQCDVHCARTVGCNRQKNAMTLVHTFTLKISIIAHLNLIYIDVFLNIVNVIKYLSIYKKFKKSKKALANCHMISFISADIHFNKFR